MICHANESLIEDVRSQSDIRQGVTLEIMGEGNSTGPLSDAMKKAMRERQGDIQYEIEWTTLGEYLEYLEKRGVSSMEIDFLQQALRRVEYLRHETLVSGGGGSANSFDPRRGKAS